jgi:hypothetical protein
MMEKRRFVRVVLTEEEVLPGARLEGDGVTGEEPGTPGNGEVLDGSPGEGDEGAVVTSGFSRPEGVEPPGEGAVTVTAGSPGETVWVGEGGEP